MVNKIGLKKKPHFRKMITKFDFAAVVLYFGHYNSNNILLAVTFCEQHMERMGAV